MQEQDRDVANCVAYAKICKIRASNMDADKKIRKISEFREDFDGTDRVLMEICLQQKREISHFPPVQKCVDLLWHSAEPINLTDPEYRAIYEARGLASGETKSQFFEINLIKSTKFDRCDLSFAYICPRCKNRLPMHFYRCPICSELVTPNISLRLEEKNEVNYPFL